MHEKYLSVWLRSETLESELKYRITNRKFADGSLHKDIGWAVTALS